MARIFSFIIIALIFGTLVVWPAILKAVYPMEYKETVLTVADKNQLNPALVYGVIVEESHFNAKAKSPKGALGLMQIEPETGKFVASSLGYTSFKDSDLFDPQLNITIGEWYLKYLLDRSNGDETKALMAYNGGESASRSATPPKESVEFARRVAATKSIYIRLYPELTSSYAPSH